MCVYENWVGREVAQSVVESSRGTTAQTLTQPPETAWDADVLHDQYEHIWSTR